MSSEPIHPMYLPFSREELEQCFKFTRRGSRDPVDIYVDRADLYTKYRDAHRADEGVAKGDIRRGRQLEKDETFWTAACLLDFQHAPNSHAAWIDLLSRVFGETPPLADDELTSWEACCSGRLHLFLEVGLPAPLRYREWLSKNDQGRRLVPYVSEAATRARTRLEGHTQ